MLRSGLQKASLILLLCGFLIGCKTKTVYIPMETVKTEYKNNYIRDSIYLHDSISVYQRGDTVFKDKFAYIFVDRLKIDSIHIRDSIPYPVVVEKPVYKDKPDSWLDTTQKYLGRLFLVVIIIGLIVWKLK